MKSPRVKRIRVNCKQKECPFFGSCAEVPTEILYYSEKAPVRMVFVGQGGGAEEEEQSRPFIGPAGQNLRRAILLAYKKQRKIFNVAFSNTIRCRPPNNRSPSTRELKYCLKHLKRDIKYLEPDFVVALGRSVIDTVCTLHMSMSISDMHGTITNSSIFQSKPEIMVTYHPSPRNRSRIDLDKVLSDDIAKAYNFIREENR